MITVCMSYYNRKPQLHNTFESMKQSKLISEVFIVIVDDASDEEHLLTDDDIPFPHKLITHTKEEKWWVNAGYANNVVLKNIPQETDVILLQNPENYHVGDVIEKVKEVKDDEYHIFSCYNLPKGFSLNSPTINSSHWTFTREGWLCHSQYNPNIYNFACAFTPNTLSKIGYFDERFYNGVTCDDDEWCGRVYKKKINIIRHDTPFVKHQYHDINILNFDELKEINYKIWDIIKNE